MNYRKRGLLYNVIINNKYLDYLSTKYIIINNL